ncbi:MAG TPA: TonB-dependent receptor [Deferrisomatales bacterium]|nr:TonB-dependent receptor [Deferrisomatales bacterium]
MAAPVSRMIFALVLGGAITAGAAPLPPTGADPAAGIVVAKAELSPATEDAFLRLYFSDDQLIQTATRAPKPVTQIAENVTVVTAQQIRDMNAHTLGEVLKRIPGVYAYTFGNHFGATPLAHIQGSGEPNPFVNGHEERHVLVLLDGIPWSSETSGPFLDTIPVGPIQRIEVIKGPASSAWGSSLGGVVNVITKAAGTSAQPHGELAGSYGERLAWDLRGELSGGAGPVGYYLQGQKQHAEWEHPGPAGFEQASGFAKARVAVTDTVALGLSAGHVDAATDAGHLAGEFAMVQSEARAAFGRVGLDVHPTAGLSLYLEGYRLDQRVEQTGQEDGTFAPKGDLLIDRVFDEEHTGVQGRATWDHDRHTLVAGGDYRHTDLVSGTVSGDFFQSLGNPARFQVEPDVDRWGLYLNDTVAVGAVTLSSGLRYDDSSRTDPFWSPSLGATWALGRVTVLRADVARGFAAPPASFLAGGGIDFDTNPDLQPEEIWSVQAGLETATIPYLWLKLTGFRHEVSDAIRVVPSSGPNASTWENQGTIWRTGYEAEAETARFGGFYARGGFSYVKVEASGRDRVQDQHQAVLGLYYEPTGTFHAEAFGQYVWWDLGGGADEGSHNDFLWDLNLRKTFFLSNRVAADLFATVHNLFNGDAEWDMDRGQEGRWAEVGVRVGF